MGNLLHIVYAYYPLIHGKSTGVIVIMNCIYVNYLLWHKY